MSLFDPNQPPVSIQTLLDSSSEVTLPQTGIYLIAIKDQVISKVDPSGLSSLVPVASSTVAGTVLVGDGLTIDPLTGKLSAVTTSGSYTDLSNKPIIPTALSQLDQSVDYRTVSDIEKGTWNSKVTSINGQTGVVNLSASDIGADASGSAASVQLSLDSHSSDMGNPHQTTKAQVGLPFVDNTSDADKPISSAAQTALDIKVDKSVISTVATSGSYTDLVNKPTVPTTLSQLDQSVDYRTVSDIEKGTWNSKVTSVNGQTGVINLSASDLGADVSGSAASVQLSLNSHSSDMSNPHQTTKTQVGLQFVDNTSDIAKPVSSATQTALDLKADKSALGTAAALDIPVTGNASITQVVYGTDSRLTDTRTPVTDWTGSTSITVLGDVIVGSIPAANVTGLGVTIANGVTYGNLNSNNAVGTGANQVAVGNHTHAYVPTTTTVNNKALTGNISLVLASVDFTGQGITGTVLHGNAVGSPTWGAVTEADLGLTDVVTNNASVTQHGFLPRLSNNATQYLTGLGTYVKPDHTALSNIGNNSHVQIDTHIASNTNPHGTTADQVLPSQTNNSGKYLTTNGTSSSWTTMPSFTGGTLASNINFAGYKAQAVQIENYKETCVVAASPGATYTFNLANGNNYVVTLNANITFTFPALSAAGTSCDFTLLVIQPATSYTLAFPTSTSLIWLNTFTAPAANKKCLLTFTSINGLPYYGVQVNGSDI